MLLGLDLALPPPPPGRGTPHCTRGLDHGTAELPQHHPPHLPAAVSPWALLMHLGASGHPRVPIPALQCGPPLRPQGRGTGPCLCPVPLPDSGLSPGWWPCCCPQGTWGCACWSWSSSWQPWGLGQTSTRHSSEWWGWGALSPARQTAHPLPHLPPGSRRHEASRDPASTAAAADRLRGCAEPSPRLGEPLGGPSPSAFQLRPRPTRPGSPRRLWGSISLPLFPPRSSSRGGGKHRGAGWALAPTTPLPTPEGTGRGGPVSAMAGTNRQSYFINKDVTPQFWGHSRRGGLCFPCSEDTRVPRLLGQVQGCWGWGSVSSSTLPGQTPQDGHQPLPPLPPPLPRNRPGRQQDQQHLLAGGRLVVEEAPGADVLGGGGGAAEGECGDVARAAPQHPRVLAAGDNWEAEGKGVRGCSWGPQSPTASQAPHSYRTPSPGRASPARGKLPSGCSVPGTRRGQWGPTRPPPAGAGRKLGGSTAEGAPKAAQVA